MTALAWAAAFVGVAVVASLVWRCTAGRRGVVDREHVSRAAASTRDDSAPPPTSPAYDVPLSFDEAATVQRLLALLALTLEKDDPARPLASTYAQLLDDRRFDARADRG
jgi:hypothetical protein